VAGRELTNAGVRSFLQSQLPAYSIPVRVEVVAESSFAQIWRHVLGVERVTPDADFFALGGTSLSVAQAVSAIRETFGVDTPANVFFDTPALASIEDCVRALRNNAGSATLGRLASAVGESAPVTVDAEPPVEPRAPDVAPPLSARQKRQWELRQNAGPADRVMLSVELDGELDQAVLERALNEIVRRHEALRTVFPVRNGEPAVEIWKPEEALVCIRADAPPEAAQIEPFDLEMGPLFRCWLTPLGPDSHLLLVAMHRLIADERSVEVLTRELGILYQSYSEGLPSPLPELPVQYGDYAVAQARVAAGQCAEPAPPLRLPYDHGHFHPRSDPFLKGQLAFNLTPDLTRRLAGLGRDVEATLLAAFQTLLHRYTGQGEIAVSCLNRERSLQLEPLIAPLGGPIEVRGNLAGYPTFSDAILRARQNLLEARRSGLVAHSPQVSFALLPGPVEPFRSGGLEMKELEALHPSTDLELALTFVQRRGHLDGMWDYDAKLFEPGAIQRLTGHFLNLLEAVAAAPGQAISSIPILSASEKRTLIEEANRTAAEYPKRCLHGLFEAQARQTPESIAVRLGYRRWTYKELNARANQVARYLHAQGVQEGARVAVRMERSFETIAGVLGILKARGCYVPIDPEFPDRRAGAILADSGAFLTVTEATFGRLDGFDTSNPNYASAPEDLACVLYASGTPARGVMVTHRSLVNHACWFRRHYSLRESDRVLQFAPLSCDAAAEEIFPILISGGTLVLRDRECVANGRAFTSFLQGNSITVLDLPTAFWQDWTAEVAHAKLWIPAALRLVVVGGERASLESLALWQEVSDPRVQWSNTYGPAETTITATYFDAARGARYPGCRSVPIGRPIANVRTYVLDPKLQPVPAGVCGELHVGGDALALGYLGQPRWTEERFIADPFGGDKEARLFRTGDLVRQWPDGNLEFLGRVDGAKMSEIEAALDRHPGVKQSVAVEGVGQRPIAYVARRPGQSLSGRELREYLRERLPDYAAPNAVVVLDHLPRDPHGKVDRDALPPPDGERAEAVAPRTATEERLLDLWRAVLEREVGVRDGFRESGGDSVKAAKLLVGVRERFGRALPVPVLQEAPTVEKMAALLDAAPRARPGMFCVYPDATSEPRLQSFRALHPKPLDGGRVRSIQEIAGWSIREMRRVHPQGPYVLAGYRVGGLVAFEMAQQLLALRQEVRFVALLDCATPAHSVPPELGRRGQAWRRIWKAANAACDLLGRELPEGFRDAAEAMLQAGSEYEPEHFPGELLVFRAGLNADPALGWREFGKEVLCLEIPGRREDLLNDPGVVKAILQRLGPAEAPVVADEREVRVPA
jgi:amino acid adenylation domain-containing protein